VNWPGSGFDPETAIFYTQAGNSAVTSGGFGGEEFEFIRVENQNKPRQPRWEADPEYGRYGTNQPGAAPPQAAAGRGGRGRGAEPGAAPAAAPAVGGGGRGGLTQGLDGLPIVKPPYGVIAAIDLNNGTLKFQVPHGDTPDAIRNNPALRGMNIPKTGQNGSVGVLVTKTLVIAGDPALTAPPGRARGAMLRAYNKQTGEQVGEVLMPAPISGSPMTFSVEGRQYIIVAVSGGNYTGEYIAFALPPSETRQTTQGGR
jgi:quinoprotein glucose dehydrogenase